MERQPAPLLTLVILPGEHEKNMKKRRKRKKMRPMPDFMSESFPHPAQNRILGAFKRDKKNLSSRMMEREGVKRERRN